MSLAEVEQAVTRICFALEPQPSDLAITGPDKERWLLYRHMVRQRLFDMLCQGIVRTRKALGDKALQSWFDQWLADDPPRTRFIREIVPAFAAWAGPQFASDAQLPPWLGDVLLLESARWEVGYLPNVLPKHIEFSFEKRPVVSRALRMLKTTYAVHEKEEAAHYPNVNTNLCVYRKPDTNNAETWVLNDIAATLLRTWQLETATITESIQQLSTTRAIAINTSFIEGLSTMLADFLKRGILIGSHP